jgi:hypothetical protein
VLVIVPGFLSITSYTYMLCNHIYIYIFVIIIIIIIINYFPNNLGLIPAPELTVQSVHMISNGSVHHWCSQSSAYVYVNILVGPCSDLSVKTGGIFVILTSFLVLFFILEKNLINIQLLCKIIQNISTKINYYIIVLY